MPNGAGNFDVVIIPNDIVIGQAGTVSGAFGYYRSDNGTCYSVAPHAVSSGTTAPSNPVVTTTWYDTTNNVIKVYNGSEWVSNVAFPLCRFSNSNSLVTSIDQIFNGFCYIGSTAFALPGVKGLFPNGRNEDGTLKTREFVNPTIRIHNVSGTYSVKLCLATNGIGAYFYAYDEVKNAIYRTDTGAYYPSDRLIVGDISYTNGVITSLQPKTTFHAVDYSDKSIISGWSMPSENYAELTLGASGSKYTAPANGWFCVEKAATAANQYMYIGMSGFAFGTIQYSTGSYNLERIFPVKKGQEVVINYTLGGATQGFRFFYAEGEQ